MNPSSPGQLATPAAGATGPNESATFADVTRYIGSLEAPSEEQSSKNLELVTRLGEPRQFLELLDEVLADDSILKTVAARSYPHVNHFEKIVLVDSGRQNGYRLTLHLWMPPYSTDEYEEELIHDHRFSFWSNIITGTQEQKHFCSASDGQHYQKYRYRPVKVQESTVENSYDLIGDFPLALEALQAREPGESYYLYYEQIHQVILPTREMTCTLVLRGPREREFANIYPPRVPDQGVNDKNEMFSPSELAGMLGRLRDEVINRRLTPS